MVGHENGRVFVEDAQCVVKRRRVAPGRRVIAYSKTDASRRMRNQAPICEALELGYTRYDVAIQLCEE